MSDKVSLEDVNYYFITDESIATPLTEQARIAVEKGVKMIQFRKKTGSDRDMYDEVKKVRQICGGRTLLTVNDRMDIALLGETDGIHLGQDDLPPKEVRSHSKDLIIGVSTHNLTQAKEAESVADYIAIGPVKSTDTKTDTAEELGIEGAKNIADQIEKPTVAIGGITKKDIPPLSEKFDMVCAISEVTKEGDLGERIDEFESTIEEIKRMD